MTGYRDQDAQQTVGIQCKCVADGGVITEKLIRSELAKAIEKKPGLREYFVVTTAVNSTEYDDLADALTQECAAKGLRTIVRIWGWGTLEEEIAKYSEARKAFDPEYSPFMESSLQSMEARLIASIRENGAAGTGVQFNVGAEPPGLEEAVQEEIDGYRDLLNSGKAKTALQLVLKRQADLAAKASPVLRCRLHSLAGHCYRQLNDYEKAVVEFDAAYATAPNDLRGIAAHVVKLFLTGDYQQAFENGRDALADNPANEGVATWCIQAAGRLDTKIDPWSAIPEALRDKQSVVEAYLDFQRLKEEDEVWRDAARAALGQFPESSMIRIFFADAEMGDFLKYSRWEEDGVVPGPWRDRLASAAQVLDDEIAAIYGSEIPNRSDVPALAANLSTGYLMLRDFEKAKKVLEGALELFPDDRMLIQRAAQIAAATGDVTLRTTALAKLGDQGVELLLRVQLLDRQDDWVALSRLTHVSELTGVAEDDKRMAEIVVACAKIRIGLVDNYASEFRKLVDKFGSDPIILVAFFAAQELGVTEIADEIYDIALATITPVSHHLARRNMAFAANSRADWRAVIKILDGHVSTQTDSEQLRWIAQAFASYLPVEKRAINFFESLSPDLRSLPAYARVEAFLRFFAGDTQAARETCEAVLAAHADDLELFLLYLSVLESVGEVEVVGERLAGTKASSFSGDPSQLMRLAHYLAQYGQLSVALELGYNLLTADPADAELAQKYVGLVLVRAKGSAALEPPPTVEDGVWVRISDEDGREDSFTIDSTAKSETAHVVYPTNPRAARFLGASVGAELTVPRAPLPERKLRLLEIKSRFLHLFHETMSSFNDRFPEEQGIQSISVREDNVQPLLDIVKAMSDRPEISDQYRELPLPLCILAASRGKPTLQLLAHLETNENVDTWSGNHDEQAKAVEAIQRFHKKAVVLDSTALWTILEIDAWDILSEVFETIYVARSTLNELHLQREEFEEKLGQEGGTLAYVGGQYIMTENRDDVTQNAIDYLNAKIGLIQASATISRSMVPEGKEADTERLFENVREKHALDAVFAASNNDALLLTEDARFRGMALGLYQVHGAWLQIFFAYAHDAGVISFARYSKLIGLLAARHHRHIQLLPGVLISLAANEPELFGKAAFYIGFKEAEITSHCMVCREFVRTLWGQGAPPLKFQNTTGELLQQLIRFRTEDWGDCISIVAEGFLPNSKFVGYLRNWLAGHFLSAERVRWTLE